MNKPKKQSKRYTSPKKIWQKNSVKEEMGQTITFSIKSVQKVLETLGKNRYKNSST